MFGHDPGHSGAQTARCSKITGTSVATLVPKWAVLTTDNITSSPVVAGGIVYAGSWDGTFYAIDAETGKVLWTFHVDDSSRVGFGRIVSTPAVDRLRVPGGPDVAVVVFGGGATLYALAPGRTGPHLLAHVSVDPRAPELQAAQAANPPQIEILSSPAVGHFPSADRIFVGMDVHNNDGVGRTGLLSFALEPNAGPGDPYVFRLVSKFDPETGLVRHSLTEGSGSGWGCGGVWSSPVVSPAALGPDDGVVAFGTSNCDHPTESAAHGEVGREAMFGIDAQTGAELWRFQPRGPNDVDDDFGSSANLLPGGAVGEGGKDGWYYARDLLTGAERWRTHAGQAGHVNTGFAVGGFIGTPAVGSYRSLTGAMRTAIFGVTAISTPIDVPIDQKGQHLDVGLLSDPTRLFSLHAIDAATGKLLWRSPLAAPSYGHVTFSNGVVFVEETVGLRVGAFDATTGLPLWLTPTLGAPSSGVAIVGDSIYFGTGTRESDLEFKAFGDTVQNLFSRPLGASPLSRLSGVFAYTVLP
jgi:outer membrane protein assembly factor BamB